MPAQRGGCGLGRGETPLQAGGGPSAIGNSCPADRGVGVQGEGEGPPLPGGGLGCLLRRQRGAQAIGGAPPTAQVQSQVLCLAAKGV